jgi:hypothetical protein
VAFAVETDESACPDANCVCPVPDVITVKQGDKVHFVNASPYLVTIEPSVLGSFNEGTITVPSKQTVIVTVSGVNSAGTEISLNMTVDAPGALCPGLPGPRMEIDN